MNILKNHVSPETAYVVDDYPYGFILRCKIRYWLEFHPKHGFRFVSQTTNPRLSYERWNKPKASTYCKFGGAMFLDANEHVQWCGLTEYCDAAEAQRWLDTYGEGVPAEGLKLTKLWVEAKIAYEAQFKEPEQQSVAPDLTNH